MKIGFIFALIFFSMFGFVMVALFALAVILKIVEFILTSCWTGIYALIDVIC